MLKLPDKPAIVVSELRAKVEERFDEIQEARKRGYSADQIAEALTKDGIKINGTTLRSYIQRILKSRQKAAKPDPAPAAPAPAPAQPSSQPRFSMKKGIVE